MTIDADVQRIAKRFGLDPTLIQAVVQAEGDIVKAVQCSIPSIMNREDALDVVCRSAVHALCDYVKLINRQPFVEFWGHRWAPVGAANDPKNLNRFWPANVGKLWTS